MDKINKILKIISINFSRMLFFVICIGMLIGNSVYLYIDAPTFHLNNIWNYLGIVINLLFLGLIVILNKKIPTFKYLNFILIILYAIFEIIYLILVPLKPFSDMYSVTQIALSNFLDGMEYLQRYNNNLPIVLLFNFIFRITTYDVFYIKIFNVLCNISVIYFAYKIYTNIYKKQNRLVVFIGIFFIPAFIYVNSTYTDIIYTALSTFIIYLVTKEKNLLAEKIIIPIILFLQYIIRPVGIILIIAVCMYYLFKKKEIKIIIDIICVFLILNFLYSIVQNIIIPRNDDIKKYPIWSWVQMGFNEAEFGFQDGTHSESWTFNDVKNRIIDLGPKRFVKLLTKKEYWLWTEGTYQSERYAFGIGENDTFDYDTFITLKLYDVEKSILRKSLNYIMKGQYFIFILFSLIDLIIKDENIEINRRKELFLYIIIGLFCFYLIWEIKSRYIYCLYPIFMILSVSGIEKTIKIFNKRKE